MNEKIAPTRAIFYYRKYERRRFKPSAFVDLTAAAKNDDGDENDNPAAIVVAEERIKAAHYKSSLHLPKHPVVQPSYVGRQCFSAT